MKRIIYFFIIWFSVLHFNLRLIASETKVSAVPLPILYHLGNPEPIKEEWLDPDTYQMIYKQDDKGDWLYKIDEMGKTRYFRDEEGNIKRSSPYKKDYIIYQFNPLSIIDVMPDSLIRALVSQINPVKSKNPKEDLIKLVNTSNLKLTTNIIIWVSMGMGFEQWHKDRTYNVGFHDVVSEWLSPEDEKNFKYNILMGLFNQNGLEEIKNDETVPLLNRSIPFNIFEERTVQLKNNSFAKNIDNANFYFPKTREVGTFWTAAISPNKKNAIISFNILLESRSNIGSLIEKSRLTYKNLLYTIDKIGENYANKGKADDAEALKNAAEIIKRVNEYGQPITKKIEFIFGKDGYREEIIKYKYSLDEREKLNKVAGKLHDEAIKLMMEAQKLDEEAKKLSGKDKKLIEDKIKLSENKMKLYEDKMKDATNEFKKANNEFEKAKIILINIEHNAISQIANSTPLRRFFSEYNLYPKESINLDDKDGKKAVEIFKKSIKDKIEFEIKEPDEDIWG